MNTNMTANWHVNLTESFRPNGRRFRKYIDWSAKTSALWLLPLIAMCGTSQAQDWRSHARGGYGGVEFSETCPEYSYVTGFNLRQGNDLDSIQFNCSLLRSDGSAGTGHTGRWYGGSGGMSKSGYCPHDNPFVRRLAVTEEGAATRIVDGIAFDCGIMQRQQPKKLQPSQRSDFQFFGPMVDYLGGVLTGDNAGPTDSSFVCPEGQAIAGIYGRAGQMIDALGIICRDIQVAPLPPSTVLQEPGTSAAPTRGAAEAAAAAGTSHIAAIPMQQGAANPTAASTASARANRLICRGGTTYATGRYGQAPDDAEIQMQMLFFLRSATPAGDGPGLEVGKCGFTDRLADDNIATVRFRVRAEGDQSEKAVREYLADPNQYWSFLVRINDETRWYEATQHAKWIPASADGQRQIQSTAASAPLAREAIQVAGNLPQNLFELNDAAIIVVGRKELTAGEAKRQVEQDLGRLSEPTRAFALCVVASRECGR